MLRTLPIVVILLVTRPATAGPKTFPAISDEGFDKIFGQLSGPILFGNAVGNGGAAVRFGLVIAGFHGTESLGKPRWMVGIDGTVHITDQRWTVGPFFQYGIGRFLIGGGVEVALHDGEGDVVALVGSPELGLPIRADLHRRFRPVALLFVRAELPATRRDAFDDRVIAGVAFVVP